MEELAEALKRIRLEIQPSMYELYNTSWRDIMYSDEVIWGMLEALVYLMANDPIAVECFSFLAEWNSIILMQRAMNG